MPPLLAALVLTRRRPLRLTSNQGYGPQHHVGILSGERIAAATPVVVADRNRKVKAISETHLILERQWQ